MEKLQHSQIFFDELLKSIADPLLIIFSFLIFNLLMEDKLFHIIYYNIPPHLIPVHLNWMLNRSFSNLVYATMQK